jgi:hypothetical protein
MNRTRVVVTVAASLMVAAGVALASSAQASTTPAPAARASTAQASTALASTALAAPATGVVTQYWQHTVKVKPATIEPFSDLSFIGVHWTKLTRSSGAATAVQHVNTCSPDCAAGKYRNTAVRLAFSRVVTSDCRPVFTRVKVTEIKSGRTATYSLPAYHRAHC